MNGPWPEEIRTAADSRWSAEREMNYGKSKCILEREQIVAWLREDREERLALLWKWADEIRQQRVGDEVHLRGLIEISNHCRRQCHYCGLQSENLELHRYRMTEEEIMGCVSEAVDYGYGTVVMQSGRLRDLSRQGLHP